jgi:hypothetical protein
MGKPFSIDDFEDAVQEYREDWQFADDHLRSLCMRHPRHSEEAVINAKLLVVGRVYSTGVERAVGIRAEGTSAIQTIATHILNNGVAFDRLIGALPRDLEHLSVDRLPQVIATHGAVVSLMRPVMREDRSVRSFSSKYLHFHCPLVPIFDSVVAASIPSLVRWRDTLRIVPEVPGYDPIYYEYVMRLWRLNNMVEAVRSMSPTPRELDCYVLTRR